MNYSTITQDQMDLLIANSRTFTADRLVVGLIVHIEGQNYLITNTSLSVDSSAIKLDVWQPNLLRQVEGVERVTHESRGRKMQLFYFPYSPITVIGDNLELMDLDNQ